MAKSEQILFKFTCQKRKGLAIYGFIFWRVKANGRDANIKHVTIHVFIETERTNKQNQTLWQGYTSADVKNLQRKWKKYFGDHDSNATSSIGKQSNDWPTSCTSSWPASILPLAGATTTNIWPGHNRWCCCCYCCYCSCRRRRHLPSTGTEQQLHGTRTAIDFNESESKAITK